MWTNRISRYVNEEPRRAPKTNSAPLPSVPPGFTAVPCGQSPDQWAANQQLYQLAYQMAQRQVQEKLILLLQSRRGY